MCLHLLNEVLPLPTISTFCIYTSAEMLLSTPTRQRGLLVTQSKSVKSLCKFSFIQALLKGLVSCFMIMYYFIYLELGDLI